MPDPQEGSGPVDYYGAWFLLVFIIFDLIQARIHHTNPEEEKRKTYIDRTNAILNGLMLIAFIICFNVDCEDTIDKMEAICIILVSIDGLIDYFCTRYNNQFSRNAFKGCNAVFAIIALVLMQVHVHYWFIHDG